LPEAAIPIAVYNIDDGSVDYIEYAIDKNRAGGKTFSSYVVYEERIFLIPYAYSDIIVIDSKTNNIEYIKIEDEAVSNSKDYDRICWEGGFCIDNHFWVFSYLNKKRIMILDLENRKIRILKQLEDGILPSAVFGGNNLFYVIPWTSDRIYIYDANMQKANIIQLNIEDYKAGINNRIIDKDGIIYLLGRDANMCLAFDKETGEIKVVDKKNSYSNDYILTYFYYSSVFTYNGKNYLISQGEESIWELDGMNKTMNALKLACDFNGLINCFSRKKRCIIESSKVALNSFICGLIGDR